MKGLIYVGLALAVMGLGFWAYRENYATQAALNRSQVVVSGAQFQAQVVVLVVVAVPAAVLLRQGKVPDANLKRYQTIDLAFADLKRDIVHGSEVPIAFDETFDAFDPFAFWRDDFGREMHRSSRGSFKKERTSLR